MQTAQRSNVPCDQHVTATPSAACTNACTSEAENENGSRLEKLVAGIRELSPEEREQLAGMLAAKGPEGA